MVHNVVTANVIGFISVKISSIIDFIDQTTPTPQLFFSVKSNYGCTFIAFYPTTQFIIDKIGKLINYIKNII